MICYKYPTEKKTSGQKNVFRKEQQGKCHWLSDAEKHTKTAARITGPNFGASRWFTVPVGWNAHLFHDTCGNAALVVRKGKSRTFKTFKKPKALHEKKKWPKNEWFASWQSFDEIMRIVMMNPLTTSLTCELTSHIVSLDTNCVLLNHKAVWKRRNRPKPQHQKKKTCFADQIFMGPWIQKETPHTPLLGDFGVRILFLFKQMLAGQPIKTTSISFEMFLGGWKCPEIHFRRWDLCWGWWLHLKVDAKIKLVATKIKNCLVEFLFFWLCPNLFLLGEISKKFLGMEFLHRIFCYKTALHQSHQSSLLSCSRSKPWSSSSLKAGGAVSPRPRP